MCGIIGIFNHYGLKDALMTASPDFNLSEPSKISNKKTTAILGNYDEDLGVND